MSSLPESSRYARQIVLRALPAITSIACSIVSRNSCVISLTYPVFEEW